MHYTCDGRQISSSASELRKREGLIAWHEREQRATVPVAPGRGRLVPWPAGALPDLYSGLGACGRVAVPGSAGGDDMAGGCSGTVIEGVGGDRGGGLEHELAERPRCGSGWRGRRVHGTAAGARRE